MSLVFQKVSGRPVPDSIFEGEEDGRVWLGRFRDGEEDLWEVLERGGRRGEGDGLQGKETLADEVVPPK